MEYKETRPAARNVKPDWLMYLLIALMVEKIIQHLVVTIAFYFNLKDIGSTVAVDPGILMVLGAVVASLFILSLWGMVTQQKWAVNLVATLLLILALSYRRLHRS